MIQAVVGSILQGDDLEVGDSWSMVVSRKDLILIVGSSRMHASGNGMPAKIGNLTSFHLSDLAQSLSQHPGYDPF